jgi:hypothetical protein
MLKSSNDVCSVNNKESLIKLILDCATKKENNRFCNE